MEEALRCWEEYRGMELARSKGGGPAAGGGGLSSGSPRRASPGKRAAGGRPHGGAADAAAAGGCEGEGSREEGEEEEARRARVVYSAGEEVLCDNGGRLYPAKVLSTAEDSDTPEQTSYLVHYKGWKATHDEWVGAQVCRDENRISD
jgi:hypothetical protein